MIYIYTIVYTYVPLAIIIPISNGASSPVPPGARATSPCGVRCFEQTTGTCGAGNLLHRLVYRWFTWVYLLKMVIFHGYVK
jgi:hypothetical protein